MDANRQLIHVCILGATGAAARREVCGDERHLPRAHRRAWPQLCEGRRRRDDARLVTRRHVAAAAGGAGKCEIPYDLFAAMLCC